MDPNELIKQAPELLKGGAALAGALKLTDVIKAMLGPATAEIAERFRDDIRLYRYGRQLECLKKAEKMAKDAGFTPKAVPIKLLFPLLEGASLEEEENLHTMWAALLANAASPEGADTVRPGFIAILKRLSHDEAAMLQWMLEQLPTTAWRIAIPYTDMQVVYTSFFGELKAPGHRVYVSDSRCSLCVNGLAAAGLIEKTLEADAEGYGYALTFMDTSS